MLNNSKSAKGIQAIYLQLQRLLATEAQLVDVSKDATLRSFSELPGPKKLDMFFNFMPGGRFSNASFMDFACAMRQKYGDIFRVPGILGQPDVVQTFSTADFEQVFRNEGQWPLRMSFDSVKHFRVNKKADFFDEVQGLIVAQGENWHKLRSTVNPVLIKPNTLKQYMKPLASVNREFIKRIAEIRDPVTLEVPATFEVEINRMSFESIAVVALNRELGLIRKNRDSIDALSLFKNARKFFILAFQLDMQPSLWKTVSTPKYRESIQVQTEIFETTQKYINEALAALEEKQSRGLQSENLSILEKLISIDRKMAIVMAMDILLAGIDSTSSTLAGILLALSKHPEKQQKLREEILQILPHKDSQLNEENTKNLPYLRAVIKETMRYYPNGPGTFRTNSVDLALSGFNIPAGTNIVLNSNSLGKDEKYFPRAQEFLPERWLRDSNNKKVDIQPFTFMPFGFGPRICIGKRIVELELELTLATLMRNYHVEFNYPAEKPFRIFFLSFPDIPLRFKFTDIEY